MLMSFSVSFANAAVIPQIFTQIGFGFKTGGPVVMVWGWLICAVFTILTSLIMGEICSTYPAAGSVYYWSGVLSKKKWAPIASYTTGWLNFIGNLANSTSLAYGLASLIVWLEFLGQNDTTP